MKKFLHKFGIHNYSQWGKAREENWVATGNFFQNFSSPIPVKRIVQEKKCIICGKIERNYID